MRLIQKNAEGVAEFSKEFNKALREDKFKDCLHPNTKQGCCDFCGKDMVGE